MNSKEIKINNKTYNYYINKTHNDIELYFCNSFHIREHYLKNKKDINIAFNKIKSNNKIKGKKGKIAIWQGYNPELYDRKWNSCISLRYNK